MCYVDRHWRPGKGSTGAVVTSIYDHLMLYANFLDLLVEPSGVEPPTS